MPNVRLLLSGDTAVTVEFGNEIIHTLSMGMSSDYAIAVQCGSTLVRIGTYLFEE